MIVDTDFPDHWKTRFLVSLLGDDEAAPVYLLRLWAHCQKRKSETFDSLPPEAVKAISRYTGDAQRLDDALVQVGFIERDGDFVTFVGWAEYNSGLFANWENGRKGGRPSKNPDKTHGITHGQPMDNPTGTHQEPRRGEGSRGDEKGDDKSGQDDPQTADKPRQRASKNEGVNEYSDEFEAFWKRYPKKHGKGAAWKAWKKIRPSQDLQKRMLSAIERHKATEQWQRENGQYVPNPATWLNEARWDDEPEQPQQPQRPPEFPR